MQHVKRLEQNYGAGYIGERINMTDYEAVRKGEEAKFKAEKNKWIVTEMYPGERKPEILRADAIQVEGGNVQFTDEPKIILNAVRCDIRKPIKKIHKPGLYPDVLVCVPE